MTRHMPLMHMVELRPLLSLSASPVDYLQSLATYLDSVPLRCPDARRTAAAIAADLRVVADQVESEADHVRK